MKGETTGVATATFVGLKPKMYLFLVDDNSEHKKAKGVKRNIVEKITRKEHKDALLSNNFMRDSMNRI